MLGLLMKIKASLNVEDSGKLQEVKIYSDTDLKNKKNLRRPNVEQNRR